MKQLIITTLFILSGIHINAQYIIDLRQLDYIKTNPESLNGYSKKKGKYIEYYYEGYNPKTGKLTISEYEEDSIDTDVVKVSDIPSMSISDWEKILDKHDWIRNEQDEDLSELKLMIKRSPYYMLSLELSFDEETSQYTDESGNLEYDSVQINGYKYNTIRDINAYSINYIKLKGNKYLLCLIKGSDIYKVIPHKNKPALRLSTVKLDNELKENRVEGNYLEEREYVYFDVEKNANEKFVIVNDANMPIGIEGDTIIGQQSPVAVYNKKKQNYDLYDPFLNKVEHNYKIRYARASNGNWLTLLIDNDLVSMVGNKIQRGITYTRMGLSVCGTVSRYKDEIMYDNAKIKLEKTKDHQILRDGIEYFSFDIVNVQDIDSLYFHGMKTQQRYSANDYHPYRSTINGVEVKDILYAKKKNGKYNLYTYKELNSKVYKQTEETFKTIIDVELGNGQPAKTHSEGEIELVPLFANDVDSIVTNSFPVIYRSNGLYGIYDINAEARYSNLKGSNSRSLIRYELPNGKQGWLDQDNGKEYEDIENIVD